eukprot:g13913.t1
MAPRARTVSACRVEELRIRCEDCGLKKTVETPKDFFDPSKNDLGKAVLAICPACCAYNVIQPATPGSATTAGLGLFVGQQGGTANPTPGQVPQVLTPGETVFFHVPEYTLQHTENRRFCVNCANCNKFVGGIGGQLEAMFGNEPEFDALIGKLMPFVSKWEKEMASFESAAGGDSQKRQPTSPSMVTCVCGERYCSDACRQADFEHSHELLCVAACSSTSDSLVSFKVHAMQEVETMILAAKVIAHMVQRRQKWLQEQKVWGVDPHAHGGPSGTGRMGFYPAGSAGWELLKQHFATSFREAAVVNPELKADLEFLFDEGTGGFTFWKRVMGLFEVCNLDIEIESPLKGFFDAKLISANNGTLMSCGEDEKKALEELLKEKEVLMRLFWNDGVTGNFDVDEEGEEDDDLEEDQDEMMEDEGSRDEGGAPVCAEIGGGASSVFAEMRAEVSNEFAIAVGGDQQKLRELLNRPWPAFHATGFSSRIARCNHSCCPNLKFDFDLGTNAMRAVALQPIQPDSELFICYVENADPVERRQKALEAYGFACRCERCVKELGMLGTKQCQMLGGA